MRVVRRSTGASRRAEHQGPKYADYTNNYTNPPSNRPRATAHNGTRSFAYVAYL